MYDCFEENTHFLLSRLLIAFYQALKKTRFQRVKPRGKSLLTALVCVVAKFAEHEI